MFSGVGLTWLLSGELWVKRRIRILSQPSDPNHRYCRYCEEATYHEYDPFFHAWVCQTCFGGMIRTDKKDPLSVLRAELNTLAMKIAKEGYTAAVKGKLKEVSGQLQQLADRS